jgi:polysaccharide chain length determinant protein (PEP-CTERM system associated)
MLGHRALTPEDYLAILKRRGWIIAVPALIFPILAISATFFIPPKYVSQTLVLIDQQKVPDDFVRSVVTEDLDSRLASMREQILSRSSIQPIIEKYNLYASQHMTMDDRIDLVRKSIDIKPIQSSIARSNGLPGFTIFFTASDPHTAQQVCAEITSLFTAANLQTRLDAAHNTTEFLQSQLSEAKRNLDDQDAKLAAFQQQNYGRLPSDEENNVNIMNTLNSQLDAANQQVQQLQQSKQLNEALLATQPASAPAGTASVETPQTQQKELDDLKKQEAELTLRYSDQYPDVKAIHRQIQDLEKQMAAAPPPAKTATPTTAAVNPADSSRVQSIKLSLQAIDMQLQAKQKLQEQIQAQIRSYQGRIESTPQVEEQFKLLTRDYESSQALYDSLQKDMQQAQEATALERREEGETFRLLDEANLPDAPTFPKRSVFALGGLAAGLAMGLFVVAILEYKDTALRTERDVWAFTQLPTLAVIAWSGGVADSKAGQLARLKRLFSRKPPKELLADAPG